MVSASRPRAKSRATRVAAAPLRQTLNRGSLLVLPYRPTERTEARQEAARERCAAGVEAFCRRALAGPVLAYAQIAEPVDPAVESERLRLRRGYRDVFADVLDAGATSGELEPHDSQTVAAALVGALGEALVGPLSRRERRREALVNTLVEFCLNALPTAATKEVHRGSVGAHA